MGKGRLPFIKLLVVVFVIAVVYSYAMFQGGFVSWFLFYSVLVICLLSLSILLVPLGRVSIQRDTNQSRYFSSEGATIRLDIKGLYFHPFCYIKIHDKVPSDLRPSAVKGSQALFFFSFKGSLTYSYPLVNLPRGEHSFLIIEVIVGDLFGFYERKMQYKVPATIVVFPRYLNLEDWKVGTVGSREKKISFSHSLDTELSLAGVRKYEPGDRLTMIDWKHSARQSELITKQFSQSGGNDCVIIFNSFIEHKSRATFENQVELGASIVNFFYKRKGTIGFLGIGKSLQWVPKTLQVDGFTDMYGILAKIECERNPFIPPITMPEIGLEESWIVVTSTLSNEFVEWLLYYHSQVNKIIVCWVLNAEHTPLEEENRINLRSKQIRVYAFTEDHFQFEKGEDNHAKI